MNKIPQTRALFYILILGLLPSLIALFYVFNQIQELSRVEEQMVALKEQSYLKEKRQALNQTLRQHYKEIDPFYIDKNLETLVFLEPEIEALQKISKGKNFPDDEGIKKRLEFLTGSSNHLNFTEGVVASFGTFQETTETLSHPLEVNIKDLHKILARIEEVNVGEEKAVLGHPQFIILEFSLDKKKSGEKSEVFLLNMKLLKREFL